MTCERPIVLRSRGIVVPCGKCFSCCKRRASEWASRLSHELPYWRFSLFVTLTYDDEHLPDLNVLDVNDYQLFLKKLRKVFGSFKYMIAGEYGSLRGRAHWHMALFCNVFDDELLKTTWGNGFIYAVPLSFKSCFYIAMYISKAYSVLYGNKLGVYNFSQGLGKRYVFDHEDELRRNLQFMRGDGKWQSLPRQYRIWLGIDESMFGRLMQESRERSRRRLLALYRQSSLSGLIGRLVVSPEQRSRLAVGRALSRPRG